MTGLRHPLTQRCQSHRWLRGQLSPNQPLSVAQTALAPAPMGLRRATAGRAPALPQLLDKGKAYRIPFSNLRLAPVLGLHRLDDALA